jgi:putative ABC transport system ATP-binding protein
MSLQTPDIAPPPPTVARTPAAVLTGVSKTYRIESVDVPALRDIDLEIPAQRFTAIAGPSGSGKTTLLNLIGCIDRPTSGQLIIAGTPVGELSDNALSDFRASNLGFVFQSFNLIPVLTAHENVEYPLRLANMPAARRRERVREVLDAVGLTAHARHRPGQLSGGQQQRVAIARALAAAPRIILADEPTANLDSHTGASIIELLRRMQREHDVSIVICSHDPQVIAAAEEVIYIRDGRVDSVKRTADSQQDSKPTVRLAPPSQASSR